MCAFMTGCTSEHWNNRAKKYDQEEVDYSILDELVIEVAGEYGPSPVELYPTPGWSNTGWGFCYRIGDIESSVEKFRQLQEQGRVGKDVAVPNETTLSEFVCSAYQSIAIHLSEKPSDEQLAFLKKMAMEFPQHWPGSNKSYPPLTILGVDLLEITIEEKLIPIE
jgi:hypothetical protein